MGERNARNHPGVRSTCAVPCFAAHRAQPVDQQPGSDLAIGRSNSLGSGAWISYRLLVDICPTRGIGAFVCGEEADERRRHCMALPATQRTQRHDIRKGEDGALPTNPSRRGETESPLVGNAPYEEMYTCSNAWTTSCGRNSTVRLTCAGSILCM